jgi:hypothetical protein
MLNADANHNFNCVLHLSGIMALIRTQIGAKKEPASGVELLILGTDSRIKMVSQSFHSKATRRSNADQPSPPSRPLPPVTPLQDLVSILRGLTDLFKSAGAALQPNSSRFETQVLTIRSKALAVRSKLLAWCSAQPETAQPVTVSRFTQPYELVFPDCKPVVCITLRADAYVDRSWDAVTSEHCGTFANNLTELIASMWNTYRQCQLHLANLICRTNESLAGSLTESSRQRECRKLQSEIEGYIIDVFASLPYLLAGESIKHTKVVGATWILPRPAMLLGGLSLQWRLFTIATLENASEVRKSHARDVLSWFGESLGIGQSKVLARVRSTSLNFGRRLADVDQMPENPRGGITAKGDALSWAGFLV